MMTEINNVSFIALKNGDGSSWGPNSVQDFTSILYIPMIRRNNAYTTSKNIAYNLQYLQFLQKVLDSVYLTDVLTRMVCKNYIITAMSVIEAIFAYIVKDTDNWKTAEWKSLQKYHIENQKEIIVGDKILKVSTEVYEKVDAYNVEMQFDAIIDKIKSKKLLTFKSSKAFDVLKRFKTLRNKVHLHITEDATDYKIFDKTSQIQMKYILCSVLKNKEICRDKTKADEVYTFLNLSDVEKQQIGISK